MASERLAAGLEKHQAGQLAEAEQIYRAVLAEDPYDADAWHLLGMVHQQRGECRTAVELIRRAIALAGDFADYHNNLATAYYQLGDFEAAASCCGEAIRLRPGFPQAHNNLGNSLLAQHRYREALECYERALSLEPRYPRALAHAAYAWRQLAALDEARACCERALQLDPRCVEAMHNLGELCCAEGKLQRAVEHFRQTLAIRSDLPETLNNLGNTLQELGDWDEAIACHQKATALRPGFAAGYRSLGRALRQVGQYEQAQESLRRLVSLAARDGQARNDLGEVLWQSGRMEAAVKCFREAIKVEPGLATAHFNLANALRRAGQLDEAEEGYRRALARRPEDTGAMTNLGITLSEMGRAREASELFEKVNRLAPDDHRAHSHLLVCKQYLPDVGIEQLAAEHAEWGRQHGRQFRSQWGEWSVAPQRQRPVRIGLVSGDFRRHPVAYLMVSALEAFDKQRFEVVCYADQNEFDEMTARIHRASAQWHAVADLSDDDLADRIRNDRIDVLFDLAGHTAGNRLLVFARKPAPLQVTWLGYVGTTGLDAIDYLVSDRFHTPEGAEPFYVERIIRLPDGYACYAPPNDAPPVSPPPVLDTGQITFGCFNNPAKLDGETLARWGEILRRTAGSRLLLKYSGLETAGAAFALRARFVEAGIDPERVVLEGYAPPRKLLERYAAVDVALDTLRYSGGVTTCEALWMGVPVVTTPGETFAGRHALSHLSAAGVTETIALTPAEYVELAAELASDVDRLTRLRRELRDRVARSPLCDAHRFARALESAIGSVWQEKASQGD